jgi:hypothetical protein
MNRSTKAGCWKKKECVKVKLDEQATKQTMMTMIVEQKKKPQNKANKAQSRAQNNNQPLATIVAARSGNFRYPYVLMNLFITSAFLSIRNKECVLCLARRCAARAFSENKLPLPAFTQPAKTQKKWPWQGEILDISTWTTHLCIPATVNCHNHNSRVPCEPRELTIHHQEREDSSEAKDKEREACIKGNTHDNYAVATLLNLLFLLRHCLPMPFYLQSRNNRVRSCSRVKSIFPKLGRQPGFSGQASWMEPTHKL